MIDFAKEKGFDFELLKSEAKRMLREGCEPAFVTITTNLPHKLVKQLSAELQDSETHNEE